MKVDKNIFAKNGSWSFDKNGLNSEKIVNQIEKNLNEQ